MLASSASSISDKQKNFSLSPFSKKGSSKETGTSFFQCTFGSSFVNQVKESKSPPPFIYLNENNRICSYSLVRNEQSTSRSLDLKEIESISGQDTELIIADAVNSSGGSVFKVYAFDEITSCWVWSTSHIMPSCAASEDKSVRRSYFLNDGLWCWDKAPKIQKQKQIDPIEVYSLDDVTNEWLHTSTMVYTQSETSGDWIWKTIQVPVKQKIERLQPINETNGGLKKKVYSLQASTGKYAWEYCSSASPVNEADKDEVLVKEYSLTDAGWSWRETLAASLAQVKVNLPVITPLEKAVEKVQDSAPIQHVKTAPEKNNVVPTTEALQSSPKGKVGPLRSVRVHMVKLCERAFSIHGPAGDKSRLNDSKCVEEDKVVTIILTPNKVIDSALTEKVTPSAEYLSPDKITLTFEQVKRGVELPPSIDPRIREQYLDDATFLQLFKVDKQQFMNMKQWRKEDMKKKIGIF